MSDDQVLDLAAAGGLPAVSAAFSSFGASAAIGQGVNGAAGGFEISIRNTAAAALDGQVISLLVQTQSGEFLIARFHGSHFQTQTATGLEPLHSLHLADAKLITGSRVGSFQFFTSPAPPVGSFTTWLAGFPSIMNPALKSPDADADGDGRSNFMEYATGGDPGFAGDPPACEVIPDGTGGMWVRFRRVPGLGVVKYTLQFSSDPQGPWSETAQSVVPDPSNANILRLQLTPPMAPACFFRLRVE